MILFEVNVYAIVTRPVIVSSVAEHGVWLLPTWMQQRLLLHVDKVREDLMQCVAFHYRVSTEAPRVVTTVVLEPHAQKQSSLARNDDSVGEGDRHGPTERQIEDTQLVE